MEIIHIVLTIDEEYARPVGAMLASLLQNKKSLNPIKIHVIKDELSTESQAKLTKIAQNHTTGIYFYDFNKDEFKGLFLSYLSRSVYSRLLIPEILPTEVNKALYLDADTIIKKDITELWNTDIADCYLAAVEDLNLKLVYDKERTHCSNLGLPQSQPYFNAGVMLINLAKWREHNVKQSVVEFIKNNSEKIIFRVQDGLNAVLWGKWLRLKLTWNLLDVPVLMYHSFKRKELSPEIIKAVEESSIVHLTGGIRPWQEGTLKFYANDYYEYLSRTPWLEYCPNSLNYFSRPVWGNVENGLEEVRAIVNLDITGYVAAKYSKEKDVILFGASAGGIELSRIFSECGVNIKAFCDNDKSKWGQELECIPIISPRELYIEDKDVPIVISSMYVDSITMQLEREGFKNIECFCSNAFYITFMDKVKDGLQDALAEIEQAYLTLGDEISKKIFKNILKHRYAKNNRFLLEIRDEQERKFFEPDIIKLGREEIFAEIDALDSLVNEKANFIKVDLGGKELVALKNIESMIKKYKSRLAISSNYNYEDLWEIPLALKKLNQDYKIYLRSYAYWLEETVCYAVAE